MAETTDAEPGTQAVAEPDDKGQTPEPTTPEPTEPEKKPEPAKDDKYLAQLRDEAAKNRKEKKAAEDELKTLKDAQLSEQERSKQEAEDSKARADALETRVKRAEIAQAAAEKVSNASLAADLIDPSKVELDEDGRATNAAELIDALIEKYPDLKATEKKVAAETDLTKVLANGEPVQEDGKPLSPEAARELFKRDEGAFHKAMDEGRIPSV